MLFILYIAVPPVQPPELTPDNTALIIGIVVGLGAGLLILIFCVGILVICGLCYRKKKNYRKYVLPYRAYMDGKFSWPPLICNITIGHNVNGFLTCRTCNKPLPLVGDNVQATYSCLRSSYQSNGPE